ncbi:hypothetical protein, partial [Oscillibacter valericigenes]|uniref:hypothetical protein n=1 Tax=Oscillibacter valericigenes TaxID=351091 RepID=UPI00195EA401
AKTKAVQKIQPKNQRIAKGGNGGFATIFCKKISRISDFGLRGPRYVLFWRKSWKDDGENSKGGEIRMKKFLSLVLALVMT